ncbi:hypothetical protein PM082_000566 [Marasmius tenuissimus]|nr:hypothetical protein PM082_000566 [Marasmius tenuissimus]
MSYLTEECPPAPPPSVGTKDRCEKPQTSNSPEDYKPPQPNPPPVTQFKQGKVRKMATCITFRPHGDNYASMRFTDAQQIDVEPIGEVPSGGGTLVVKGKELNPLMWGGECRGLREQIEQVTSFWGADVT